MSLYVRVCMYAIEDAYLAFSYFSQYNYLCNLNIKSKCETHNPTSDTKKEHVLYDRKAKIKEKFR